jgi:hypothetical protein
VARTRRRSTLRFDQRLVLNRWMLGLFGVESFDELADEEMKDPRYEEWDQDNVSGMYHLLVGRFFDCPELSADDLLRYDQNIVRHTLRISERRDGRVRWKYFQYLSLLFAEIYLDRYFRDPGGLLEDLNEHVRAFNEDKSEADAVPGYAPEDLRKLAFWMATGSGKTLIMHVNVLQYLHYLDLHGRADELDRIILLTPNEGLSRQHHREFRESGFDAELFSRSGESLFTTGRIEILEVTKLAEDSGVTRVAVEAFEGNNLVLVDEGHRGMSTAATVKEVKKWKARRDLLCEGGFSFEYSATFGQAMKSAKDKDLADEYARCILFDYSYRYFYRDGYGKDYRILNLEDGDEPVRHRYLTAALLAFHQQQLLFKEREKQFRPYGIERPLWMFVGSRVTGSGQDEKTDVVRILLFLSRFLSRREESIETLKQLMSGNTGLHHKNRDLFADEFGYLHERGLDGAELYDSILRGFFNSAGPGRLRAGVLKAAEGEVSLRLGDNEPFGVVNVGKAAELAKLLEEQEDLIVSEDNLSSSLFRGLDSRGSRVNLLVGARKFAEGWSSWRVSSVGLMKVGRNEGSQIIQLFGRGVRLKGLDFGLKRSSQISGVGHPRHIGVLETLGVFGVSADYMRQFKEHLEEEGIPDNEDVVEVSLPTIVDLGDKKLKTIRLGEGGDFGKNGPKPVLDLPASLGEPAAGKLKVRLDRYPKVQALSSRDGALTAERETGRLEEKHLAFMDLDAVYFELVRHKEERGWHNLTVSREKTVELLKDPGWYELSIPPEDLEFGSGNPMRKVRDWQEIAVSLLKAYCKKYYETRQNEFQAGFLEYRELAGGDPNVLSEYSFTSSNETAIKKLRDLKKTIEDGSLKPVEWSALEERWNGLDVFPFDRHLYNPLVHLSNKDVVTVKPVALNPGEQRFVRDLERFHDDHPGFFEGVELYLLRNLSKGRGIGFFEAGNFYPDFLLWLVLGDRQHVAFVDPKGIRNLQGTDDPKISFHETIKEIESRLGDPEVTLDSFILSNTSYGEVSFWRLSKEELEDRHVLFQEEDRHTYVRTMLKRILGTP